MPQKRAILADRMAMDASFGITGRMPVLLSGSAAGRSARRRSGCGRCASLSSVTGSFEFLNLLLEPQIDQRMGRDTPFFGGALNGF